MQPLAGPYETAVIKHGRPFSLAHGRLPFFKVVMQREIPVKSAFLSLSAEAVISPWISTLQGCAPRAPGAQGVPSGD